MTDIHPTAVISPKAQIGTGVRIGPYSIVEDDCVIGDDCVIDSHVKIARYTLDSWANLKQYNLMDELRSQLKTINRQFDFYMKHKSAMKNNLIGLINLTYPGANTYFDCPARKDGGQKWVDFLDTYWHVDCVRRMSLHAFTVSAK